MCAILKIVLVVHCVAHACMNLPRRKKLRDRTLFMRNKRIHFGKSNKGTFDIVQEDKPEKVEYMMTCFHRVPRQE